MIYTYEKLYPIKVKDYNYFTGEFKEILGIDCNLLKNIKNRKISIIGHNCKRYDFHLFIKHIAKAEKNQNINEIIIFQ